MASKKAGPPAHPPYAEMIKDAISSLKERGGSSLAAIKKSMAAAHKLPDGWEKKLSIYLKKMTADGKLMKVKGSWKLGEAMKGGPAKAKKPRALKKKKPASAKPAVAKKARKPKTGGVVKKAAAPAGKSKAGAAKPKVKKPVKKAAAPKKAAPKKAPVKKPAKKAGAAKKK